MNVTAEGEEKLPVTRPRAIRWALWMAGTWILISGVMMAVVLPFQRTDVTASPTLGKPAGAAPGGGGLFYRAMNSMTYQNESDGQIHIDASVDTHSIHFVLDPQASETVLSPEDAADVGVDADKLTFTDRMQIDQREVAVAPVTVHYLSFHNLTLFSVQALVTRQSQTSVLGMDFLKRFDSYKLEDGTLTLHW